MWTYAQRGGELINPAGEIVGMGYAGHGIGKNNPGADALHDIGPAPRGFYTIDPPTDTPTHGPFVLRLTPDPANAMHGRSGFLIHGDSVVAPGTASNGCLIFPRRVRELVWASGDRRLEVMAAI